MKVTGSDPHSGECSPTPGEAFPLMEKARGTTSEPIILHVFFRQKWARPFLYPFPINHITILTVQFDKQNIKKQTPIDDFPKFRNFSFFQQFDRWLVIPSLPGACCLLINN